MLRSECEKHGSRRTEGRFRYLPLQKPEAGYPKNARSLHHHAIQSGRSPNLVEIEGIRYSVTI